MWITFLGMNDDWMKVTWLDHFTDYFWIVFPFAIFLGVGAYIGKSRGRLPLGCILGLCLGPVGWLIVGLLSDRRTKCPECRGLVDPSARKCRHCGSVIPSTPSVPSTESTTRGEKIK